MQKEFQAFKKTRLMRYSSNPLETHPYYIQELLKYNEVYHQNFDPHLLTKTSKKIYDEVLGLKVPPNENDFDRRYMVKPPYKNKFNQTEAKSQVSQSGLIQQNMSKQMQSIKRQKDTIQSRYIYSKFVHDYQSPTSRDELSFNQKQALQEKIKRVYDEYEIKMNKKKKSLMSDNSIRQTVADKFKQMMRVQQRKEQIQVELIKSAERSIRKDYEKVQVKKRQSQGEVSQFEESRNTLSVIDTQTQNNQEKLNPEQQNEQSLGNISVLQSVQQKLMLGELIRSPVSNQKKQKELIKLQSPIYVGAIEIKLNLGMNRESQQRNEYKNQRQNYSKTTGNSFDSRILMNNLSTQLDSTDTYLTQQQEQSKRQQRQRMNEQSERLFKSRRSRLNNILQSCNVNMSFKESELSLNQMKNLAELIDDRNYEQECNTENFFTDKILKQFKDQNIKTSKFIQQMSKDSLWKPDKYVPPKIMEVEDKFIGKK
ncbi:UNKNOWN [Stylonychia lemnae]|uniref:Uncharacterized protein n=1 Tax=Stylonychia lemnae TaxID=5949 RepID=A0A078B2Q9_STYLE|nr:UNKNOWN [Stylonychia lemnae]|eukprot:CDW87507.1 UNKNOWN [Stylonychia lemnae]